MKHHGPGSQPEVCPEEHSGCEVDHNQCVRPPNKVVCPMRHMGEGPSGPDGVIAPPPGVQICPAKPLPASYNDDLHKLIVLGYSKEKAQDALELGNYELHRAMNILHGRDPNYVPPAPGPQSNNIDGGDGEEDTGDGPQ